MPIPIFGRGALTAFTVATLASSSVAQAAEEETQLWIGASATMKASPHDIVVIDIGHRFRRDESGGEQQLARIAVDHALAEHVQVGGGFAFFHSGPEQELRTFQQLTLTQGIWQSRTRLEQRFFDTADEASWRLRQRIQAAIPLDAAKKWTLVAAGELFFHLNRAKRQYRPCGHASASWATPRAQQINRRPGTLHAPAKLPGRPSRCCRPCPLADAQLENLNGPPCLPPSKR